MKFQYEAVNNKSGQKEKGLLEAVDLNAAGKSLREQGLVPTDLNPVKENAAKDLLARFKRVKLKEKLVFIQDLSIMLKAGIGITKGLRILTAQGKGGKLGTIISEIATAVESGVALNEAMSKYPKVFSNIFVSMVKVGEVSGNLEKSLGYLAVQLQREDELKSKTKGAMMYPAVILSAMVIIGVVMSVVVLPKLTEIFKEFEGELPFTTKLVIGFADFASGNAIIVVAGLIGLVFGIVAALRTPAGKRGLHWFLLHFPLTKELDTKINIARFARIFSSLLKSGINVVEGLQVSGEAIANPFYRDALLKVSEEVKLGKPMTETLEKYENLFPFIVVQMLKVGEETGTLETILEQIAEHFESEVDDQMKNLSSIIEPVLLLVIGGVVGFLAMALIAPIYNISQNIQ